MRKAPSIGVHLATLNLFREADGSLHITVADCSSALIADARTSGVSPPINYVEGLIVEAAANLKKEG